MALTELLRLVIDADARGAVQGIEKVGRTADRELSRAEKSIDRWAGRLTAVGTRMVAFGAVSAAGLAMTAKSAADLEQAVGGTEAVFGDARRQIDDYAETAAESVGLSERAFRELTTVTGAQLKTLGFGLDEAADKSIQLTEIGADLAATYGGSTQEAVEALGAAFRGEADPAERFGLRLNINTANAKAVAMGLAESTSAVDDHARAQAILALVMEQSADAQGQFAREADTATGQQQRLAAQFEDLKAEIGQGVVPAMKTLTDVAGNVVGGISGLNEATDGFLGKAATWVTVGSLAGGGLSLVAGQAIKLRDTVSSVSTAVQSLATRFGGLGRAAAFVGGPAALVAAAGALELWNQAEQRSNIERLTTEFLAAGDSAQGMSEVMASAASHGPAEMIGVFEELARTNQAAAERFLEQMEAAGADQDVIDQMRGSLESTSAAQEQTAQDTEAATGEIEGQAGAYDDARSALEGYNDALRAQFDPLFGAIDATRQLGEANAAVTEAEAALSTAIAEHGAESAEAMLAQQALTDAQLAAAEAALGQEGALATLKDAVDSGAVSIDVAKAKLQQWVDQGLITQESADATARELDGVTTAADGIPDSINLDIGATDNATPTIDSVQERLRVLPSGKTILIDVLRRDVILPGSRNVPARAHGGPVEAGGIYEVAEEGRHELLSSGGRTFLIPGRDGEVIPLERGPRTAGGALPGGNTYNVSINVHGGDPDRVVDALRQYMRANGPVPIQVAS